MNWTDPTEEDRVFWQAWLDERPPVVRQVAERFNPWTMYRLTTTGQRCAVLAFASSGTVRVYAEHETLGPVTGVEAFGIAPETLVPWDGSARPEWIVEEIPGGQDLGNGYATAPGVSYRIEGEPEPEGGWSRFTVEVVGIADGVLTLERKPDG